MNDRMNLFTYSFALSVAHDIEDEFRYFIENNTSNNLPYHNLYHSLCVMNEVGRMIDITDYFDLTSEEERDLLIASLYHDYHYTIGPIPDNLKVDMTVIKLPIGTSFNDRVRKLIKYTAYPYSKDIILNENISKIDYMGLILREADLCQCLKDNSIQQCIFGLKDEMDPNNKITYYEFIDEYIKFIEGIKYQIVNREGKKRELLTNLRYLKSCFSDVKEKS